MNPKAIFCRGYVKALGEAVEAWKECHDEAMKVGSLEELIPDVLALRDMMRDTLKKDFERLFANKLNATQLLGQVARQINLHTLGIFDVFADGIRWAEQRGYEVGQAGDFEQAFQDVRRLSDDFDRRWPLFDPEELEEARAQAARGEFASDEEVWRELQG